MAAFPDPTITQVTPGLAEIASGVAIQIEGQNFTPDDAVFIDEQPLVNQSLVSATEIDGETPSLTTAQHEIQIRRCGTIVARFVQQCIAVTLNVPACTAPGVKHFTGNVSTCDQAVSRIAYTLNENDPVVICESCGVNPAFAFDVTLPAGQNTIKVTASDANGGEGSVTKALLPDTTPPVIQCPPDFVTENQRPCGATVEFTVTAQDECDGPVTVVCTPASGSLFPAGPTTVHCVATDASGNSAECNFTVTVSGGTQFLIPP